MELTTLIDHLEEGQTPVDLLDLDRLLKRCGFRCRDYGHTLVYSHDEWNLDFTFDRTHRQVPRRYVKHIFAVLRKNLQEGTQ